MKSEADTSFAVHPVILCGGIAVQKFFEKPDLARARQNLASGDYCRDGGIFAFRPGSLLNELARHRPQMAELVGLTDSAGNVALCRQGGVDIGNCRNVVAINDGPHISAIGLEDVCIIVAGDEVLVITRDGAQAIGKLPGAANQ